MPHQEIPKETLILALISLNAELEMRGKSVDMLICGGASMCLYLEKRDSTRDIDAMYNEKALVDKLVEKISKKLGLKDSHWLNDRIIQVDSELLTKDTPKLLLPKWSALTISTVTPEYLLTLKMLASRSGIEYRDEQDIHCLFEYLSINSESQALGMLRKYFPKRKPKPETINMIRDILKYMEWLKTFPQENSDKPQRKKPSKNTPSYEEWHKTTKKVKNTGITEAEEKAIKSPSRQELEALRKAALESGQSSTTIKDLIHIARTNREYCISKTAQLKSISKK
jgi:hypothetical protein